MTKAPKIARDDGKPLTAFGVQLDESGAPIREVIPARKPGEDYGCDPLGDGKFRMVPSGDIVDLGERNRRLHAKLPDDSYIDRQKQYISKLIDALEAADIPVPEET